MYVLASYEKLSLGLGLSQGTKRTSVPLGTVRTELGPSNTRVSPASKRVRTFPQANDCVVPTSPMPRSHLSVEVLHKQCSTKHLIVKFVLSSEILLVTFACGEAC